MSYFFTSEAVVPMRGEPKESAEMVSQVLFGEKGEILTTHDSWCQIRCAEDDYEGWVDRKMILEIDPETVEAICDYRFVLDGALLMEDQTEMRLPLGARIPLRSSEELPVNFQIENRSWSILDSLHMIVAQEKTQLISLSRYFLNIPYLWGGRSGWGLDCSGFIQVLFRMVGLKIPRDASLQASHGEEVPFGEHMPGDLAFFRKENQNRITHVGMLVSKASIIHASGKVRLDFLRENGIINARNNQLTHNLVFIKRF